MSTKGERYVKEYVIGFGFLSGIFLAIGVDPQAEILKNLLNLLAQYNPDLASWYTIIFGIISVLILILTVLYAYGAGGLVGIVAILFAFGGGLLILWQPIIGIILLIIGVFLGRIAPNFLYCLNLLILISINEK